MFFRYVAGPSSFRAPRRPVRRFEGSLDAQTASAPVSPVRMRIASSIDGHENLAVADAAGLRRLADRLDGAVEVLVGDDDLDLHLGQEVDDIFGAAIKLGMALLAAETLGLGHRDALYAGLLQRLLDLIELEGLDDRFDFFHGREDSSVKPSSYSRYRGAREPLCGLGRVNESRSLSIASSAAPCPTSPCRKYGRR